MEQRRWARGAYGRETQEISDRGNQVEFGWANEPRRNSDRLTRQWWLWFPAAGHQTTPQTLGNKRMKTKSIGAFLVVIGVFWIFGYSLIREPVIGEMARHFKQILPSKDCFTREEVAGQIDSFLHQIWDDLPSIRIPCYILLAGICLYMHSLNKEAKCKFAQQGSEGTSPR